MSPGIYASGCDGDTQQFRKISCW